MRARVYVCVHPRGCDLRRQLVTRGALLALLLALAYYLVLLLPASVGRQREGTT